MTLLKKRYLILLRRLIQAAPLLSGPALATFADFDYGGHCTDCAGAPKGRCGITRFA